MDKTNQQTKPTHTFLDSSEGMYLLPVEKSTVKNEECNRGVRVPLSWLLSGRSPESYFTSSPAERVMAEMEEPRIGS